MTTYKDAAIYTGQKYTSPASNHVDCYLSMPYCLAAATIDGELTPRQLAHTRIADAQVHEFAQRVAVREDTAMSARYPQEFPVSITFLLRDGRRITDALDQFAGSSARPPAWPTLAAKFHDLADEVIGARNADTVCAAIQDLAHCADVGIAGSSAGGNARERHTCRRARAPCTRTQGGLMTLTFKHRVVALFAAALLCTAMAFDAQAQP